MKRCFVCNEDAGKKCGRCKEVWYCTQICQRQHWQNGHREECISLTDQDTYKRVVGSGLPRQMNQVIPPTVDAAMYNRGVSSGAYRDRSVKLGQGVTLHMTGADGYIVEIRKDDQIARSWGSARPLKLLMRLLPNMRRTSNSMACRLFASCLSR